MNIYGLEQHQIRLRRQLRKLKLPKEQDTANTLKSKIAKLNWQMNELRKNKQAKQVKKK